MRQSETRKREIAQGLRDEQGGLIGGLDILECFKAQEDFEAGRPPPRITSTSYDVWRARLAREADEKADVRAKIAADDVARMERMREVLKDHPDILAQYEAEMARIEAQADPTRTPPNASVGPGRPTNPTPSHRQGGETT